MSGEHASRRDASTSSREFQFSLRAVFIAFLVFAVILAIASRFPRHSAFTVLMSLLLLFPLAVVSVLRTTAIHFGLVSDDWRTQRQGRRNGRIRACAGACFSASDFASPRSALRWRPRFTAVAISTITLTENCGR